MEYCPKSEKQKGCVGPHRQHAQRTAPRPACGRSEDLMGCRRTKTQNMLATQSVGEQPLFTLVSASLPLPSITAQHHPTYHQPWKIT